MPGDNSGGSRLSAGVGGGGAFEGLTVNVKFYEDNPGSAQNMRHFRKKWVGEGGGGVGGGSQGLSPESATG